MELQTLIEKSYGEHDAIFALHPKDRERALQSLIVADEQGIGFSEFLEKHRTFLKEFGVSDKHIEEQLARVKDLTSYLRD